MKQHYIGLMSGTSADGVDAALVSARENGQIQTESFYFEPYPANITQALRNLAVAPSCDWQELFDLERVIVETSAKAVHQLLNQVDMSASDIKAIGSHGHTIRHLPPDGHRPGTSYQIGDPSRIAELTSICCVADFRRRDMAAGGQGAPLVPAFHQICFGQTNTSTMVLNLGGIANLTVLGRTTFGFDTGPGNCLLDEYCQQQLNQPRDEGGLRASIGIVCEPTLNQWLSAPYFSQPLPKSTGRELFLLNRFLPPAGLSAEDALATLAEFTARSVALAATQQGHPDGELLVCGGGVHNLDLMNRLQRCLPNHSVMSTLVRGIDPDSIEATAFAWLAMRTLSQQPGNLPEATGANGPRILGGIYPA